MGNRTKYCKDCKWYVAERWSPPSIEELMHRIDAERCSNPKTITYGEDPVYGKIIKFAFECDVDPHKLRKIPAACGPTAKWFEEKERPIPLCVECKYYFDRAVPTAVCTKAGIPSTATHIELVRLNECLCGKYGKWFEKKEERPIAIIRVEPTKRPKKRSWLCKHICGEEE